MTSQIARLKLEALTALALVKTWAPYTPPPSYWVPGEVCYAGNTSDDNWHFILHKCDDKYYGTAWRRSPRACLRIADFAIRPLFKRIADE